MIGGTVAGAKNVISGQVFGSSGGDGIRIERSSGNIIQGNYIGTNMSGTEPIPNFGFGVNAFEGVRSSIIGSTEPGGGNLIAFNTHGGVLISTSAFTSLITNQNSIRGNSIHSNGGLGIDMATDTGTGVTPNDHCDGDVGPLIVNDLQNYPILTLAATSGSGIRIKGTLDSVSNSTFFIDFYSSPTADSTGFGEGKVYLGSTSVTTGAGCTGSFSTFFPGVNNGQFITATATDTNGNTSEFSQAVSGTPGMVLETRADFDGDGKTDLSVFRPGDGNWYVSKSNGGFLFQNWGIATDILTPGDYDNDGKADLAVFRPSTGNWFVFRSLDSTVGIVNWGTNGDMPVAGDYDNDGKTDVAVFRPSTGNWFVVRSSDGQFDIFNWGVATDIAVPGDYDGDGRTDKAIFRPSTGQWFVFRSSDSQVQVVNWGVATDRLVPADYDGDNHDDMAVFRPSTGDWFILRSSDSQVQVVNWGIATDIAAPGDFDGDGKDEPAVFRPSNGNWYANQSTGGFMIANWGTSGDRPITAGYIPTAP